MPGSPTKRPRGPASGHALTKLIQTHVRETTGAKFAAKAARLGFKESAYLRRLIELDVGELKEEET